MRTACRLLYWNLAFRTLVRQEQEVNEPDQSFEVPRSRLNEYGIAFRALFINFGLPFAFICGEHVVAGLRGTFLDVRRKGGILFEEPLFQLVCVLWFEGVESDADINGWFALKGRNDLTSCLILYFGDGGFEVLVPTIVADD